MDVPGSWQPGQRGGLGNPLDYGSPPIAASTTTAEASVQSGITGAMTAESPADGASFDVDDATGFPTPPSSTLAVALDDVDGEATLDDASGFDDSGEIKVNGERIGYGSRSGDVLGDLTRGVGGTTVASHAFGDAVRQPVAVALEREELYYHTLSSDTLGDIRRVDPVAHEIGALAAPQGLALELTSVAGFSADGGSALIEDEEVAYLGVSGSDITGVFRGVNGTAVAAHSSGADIDAKAYTSRLGFSARRGSGAGLLPVPNTSGGALSSNTMVSRNPVAGTGGMLATTEGDPILGILARSVSAGAWGLVQAGGFFSMLLDASFPELPASCEPVFAASSSTVKSLENADSGDKAVGRCLRVHTEDHDGSALTNPRVDMVMLTELLEPHEEP